MKKLIYFPIVHSQADLGSVAANLSDEGQKKYGEKLWKEHLKSVDKSWDIIELFISQLIFQYPNTKFKIYQDGLPAIGELGLKIIID